MTIVFSNIIFGINFHAHQPGTTLCLASLTKLADSIHRKHNIFFSNLVTGSIGVHAKQQQNSKNRL